MDPYVFEHEGCSYELRFEPKGRGSRCFVFCDGTYTGHRMSMPTVSLEQVAFEQEVFSVIFRDIVKNTSGKGSQPDRPRRLVEAKHSGRVSSVTIC